MTETQSPLATQTPREIDEQLAALDGAYFKLGSERAGKIERTHHLLDERPRYISRNRKEWPTSADEALNALALKIAGEQLAAYDMPRAKELIEAVDTLDTAIAANRAAYEVLEAEYARRPWTRFFLVQGGHIHSGMWCQGGSIRWDTVRGWQPELSDTTAEAAVAKLGPLLCTKCFPSAPVEYTRGLEKKLPEGYCTGQGQQGRNLQMQYASPRGKCPECGQGVGVTSLGRVRRHKLDRP